jgi:DNA-binding transcriptional regulator YiaG
MKTTCTTCKKGLLRSGTEVHTLRLGEQTFTAKLPVKLCNKCNESLMSGETLGAFEVAVAQYLARKGPASGENFAFMRKAIGLSGVDLADLLRTSKETVSRWETGKHAVDIWAWITLGSLVLDHVDGRTMTMERLRALRAKELAKTVPVELPHVASR